MTVMMTMSILTFASAPCSFYSYTPHLSPPALTTGNGMSELYISKTREVVANIRRPSETVDGEAALKSSHVNQLNAAILANPRASGTK